METKYIVKPRSAYAKRSTLFFSPYCKCGYWLKAFRSCDYCNNCGAKMDWSTFYDDEYSAWQAHYDILKQNDILKQIIQAESESE